MPILNVQLPGQVTQADGETVAVGPFGELALRGARVQVAVSVGQPLASRIIQAGGVVPPPRSGLAVIDTGAAVSCVDEAAAQQLHLPVVDVVRTASASHASVAQNVYSVQIEVVGLPITADVPCAIGAPLSSQGVLALIGRDILRHCLLIYNGPAGSYSLAI